MAVIEFEDLRFTESGDFIRVTFLGCFYFTLEKADLNRIGNFRVGESYIEFDACEKPARNRLNLLIAKGLQGLWSSSKQAFYIHKNSGVPLIGTQYFGLVDRNTNLIEVRPQTGCNLDCIYCSVDEGHGRQLSDYVVEMDYLLEEFRKLADYKDSDDIEAHINPQGEPLLYSRLTGLVSGLSSIRSVRKVSIDTNGTLLTEKMIDSLAEAGLTQLNVSINAIDPDTARKISCQNYDPAYVLSMIGYASQKLKVIIAPVLIQGVNEKEIEELIVHVKENDLQICIQNYQFNKHGRNPVKALNMDDFNQMLKSWEKRYDVKLVFDAEDFCVHKTKKLLNPFRKGEKVRVSYVMPGRLRGETLAVARDRVLQIRGRNRGIVTISRTKHNIIIGK